MIKVNFEAQIAYVLSETKILSDIKSKSLKKVSSRFLFGIYFGNIIEAYKV